MCVQKRKTTEPADFIRAALRAFPGVKVSICKAIQCEIASKLCAEYTAGNHA